MTRGYMKNPSWDLEVWKVRFQSHNIYIYIYIYIYKEGKEYGEGAGTHAKS